MYRSSPCAVHVVTWLDVMVSKPESGEISTTCLPGGISDTCLPGEISHMSLPRRDLTHVSPGRAAPGRPLKVSLLLKIEPLQGLHRFWTPVGSEIFTDHSTMLKSLDVDDLLES